MLVSSAVQVYNIPTSCCREGTNEEICKVAVQTGIGAQISSVIHSEVSMSVTFDCIQRQVWVLLSAVLGCKRECYCCLYSELSMSVTGGCTQRCNYFRINLDSLQVQWKLRNKLVNELHHLITVANKERWVVILTLHTFLTHSFGNSKFWSPSFSAVCFWFVSGLHW
jgi:hypothetical protein